MLLSEAIILLRAAKDSLYIPAPKKKTGDFAEPKSGRFGKREMQFYLALLLFALPFGIWTERFDSAATFPLIVGAGVNLFLVWALSGALFQRSAGRLDGKEDLPF